MTKPKLTNRQCQRETRNSLVIGIWSLVIYCNTMLNAIIRFSLRYRLLTIAMALVLLVYGSYVMYQLADRRVSRPESAARHDHDRSARAGAGRSRDADHVSAGIGAQRGDRRAGGAQLVGRRAVGDLRRVRLGHRHLHRPADRRRKDGPGRRSHAGRRPAAAGADLVDHGPDHDHRHVERRRQDRLPWSCARWPIGSCGSGC